MWGEEPARTESSPEPSWESYQRARSWTSPQVWRTGMCGSPVTMPVVAVRALVEHLPTSTLMDLAPGVADGHVRFTCDHARRRGAGIGGTRRAGRESGQFRRRSRPWVQSPAAPAQAAAAVGQAASPRWPRVWPIPPPVATMGAVSGRSGTGCGGGWPCADKGSRPYIPKPRCWRIAAPARPTP